ncbi:SIMPL domain-containing protein [Ferroacidibacillus organovorans]|uniref:SIMPL domain-containing protein n=1 Tax=Ferroacidibacillus organovorans TaxID=1765683 RepID=A0A853KCY3_9BACL|nr:SIMPL domain-containing protein [Ferroacidibacillus organovorans]KYP81626.1 hypothetical protein AYJ22_06750 [Ferroacidibacillus organovorans]OAG94975.1 hypothetical protein AYW79_03030 [Ferroacidibacillus organovorans]
MAKRNWMVGGAITVALLVGGVTSPLVLGAHAMGMGNTPSSTTTTATQTPNTITVTGIAGVYSTDNVATVNMSMNINDQTVLAVTRDEAHIAGQLTQEFRHLGIPQGDISTLFQGINNNGNMSNESGNLNVNVTVASASLLPKVMNCLSTLTEGYVSNVYSNVQYAPMNLPTIRTQLFAKALADAKSQAQTLASDVGATVGSVVSVTSPAPVNTNVMNGPALPNQSLGGISTTYGYGGNSQNYVSSQVTVTYQLIQG